MEKFHLDREFDHKENDRPSRPTSRDSRVSRDSQGSKQSKGSRNSGDKLSRKMNDYAPEPLKKDMPARGGGGAHPLIQDFDAENKKAQQPAPVRKPQSALAQQQQPAPAATDLRGYFRDAPIEEKKIGRTAPGPITREKLEASEAREMSSMTQLKKRDARPDSKQQAEQEEMGDNSSKLAPLVDTDLLENISEDEDTLLEGEADREDRNQAGGRGGRSGRQRGGQQQADLRKQQQQQFPARGGASGRGDRGGAGGGRGAVRGGRGGGGGDNRMGRGGSGRWQDNEFEAEESEEARKNRKNREEKVGGDPKFSQPPPTGFALRGQPSRRGRGGENNRGGRMGGPAGRGGVRPGLDGGPEAEEGADWGDEDPERRGGNRAAGGKPMPPRMQRKKEESGSRARYPGSKEAAEEGEEWETASENSNEDMKRNSDRRSVENDRGRGGSRGRGWEQRGRRGGGAGGGGGHQSHGSAQQLGGIAGENAREQTPEAGEGFKKRANIENFDLHDYASVVVVDQGEAAFAPDQGEFEGGEGAGEFMQVVGRKVRGPPQPPIKEDRRSFERQGPKMAGSVGEKVAYNDYKYREYSSKDAYDKKINKNSFDRRQSKLPPRLAKQREVSRAQARTGLSPTGMEANGWPEGDKMGVFQVDDLGTNAWEKPGGGGRRDKDGMETAMDLRSSPKVGKEISGIQQTMVFENTALKSVKSGDKMGLDKAAIQPPMGSGKPEDGGDLKLDFSFGGDDLPGQGKPPISMPRALPHLAGTQGLPASPSTDDLSAKLANTKKLWDAPGMAVVQENSVAGPSWNDAATFNDNFEGFQHENQTPDGGVVYDKNENGGPVNNVAKVKPQQQQQLSLDPDNRPSPLQYGRMANNGMPGAVPSPPTQIGQMSALQAAQPWAFQMERTSPMYNPYGAGQLSQSILMPGAHSIGTDLFTGSNGAGGYHRLQGTAGHYPGSQQNPTNNVLISQASLISGGVKHSNQIGPIGTKAGTGASSSPYLQSGLGALPNTFIQYEPGNYNYLNPNAAGMQRGNAPPSQTAFYQTLANRQPPLALNALQGEVSFLSFCLLVVYYRVVDPDWFFTDPDPS
jgi:hypothetical protein